MQIESLDVRSIFDRALDIASEAERTAFLDEACAAAPESRHKVEALLSAYANAGSFLEAPVIDREQTGVFCPVTESPGSQIGPYKLLEQIGEGGMGVVFMAEQTRPVQRRVALKIIKAGMDTRQVVARFEAERQALAMMDHPNIAKVLDAGATGGEPGCVSAGRPYFVMELVRGIPMTEFCNQKNLSIRERLELFVTVCQAVQHAHQKGIIHRDIKPTNVLVTLHDGRPVIKVIDFGVAKATGQKLTDKTLFTGFTQMIGTPLYMSPEQAEMTSQDIDTRSDIFSAGVLLYELLTGTTPFDSQRLKSASFDELRRIIREEEPPRPSTRLTTLRLEAASTVGTERKTDPRHLSRLFRGELDWIVMKCLEKDRTRRYETASALAGDVERYLHDEPVQACPPSARYRFGKFARRNKAALLTAGAVIVALVLGTAVSTWQAIRAYNAEAQAKTSEQQANSALGFLMSAFRSPDPRRDGRAITMAEVLERSSRELQVKFADDPLTKAMLLQAIGESYIQLGLHREAIPLLEQARDLLAGTLGGDDLKTITAIGNLASAYGGAGRYDEALRLREEVFNLRKAMLGPDHPDTLNSMRNLAFSYHRAGRIDEALRMQEETFKVTKGKLGPDHPDTLASMQNLAHYYADAGRNDEALRLDEDTLKLMKDKLGPNHPDTLGEMNNLAADYRAVGRMDEALRLDEETLKLTKEKLGPDHPDTLESMNNLAADLANAGRDDESLRLQEETLKLAQAKWGAEHPGTIVFKENLATSYRSVGRRDKALRLFEETLALSKAKLGSEHPQTLTLMFKLADCFLEVGRINEAIELNEKALKLRKVKLGPNHPDTLASMCDLAFDYLAAGRLDDALRLSVETVTLMKDKLGPDHPDTLNAMENLAQTYERADRLKDAEAVARQCWGIRETKSPDDWQTYRAESLLGDVLLGQKKYAEAEPLLVSGYEGMHERKAKILPTYNKPRLQETLQRIVQLYEATNQPDKAAAWKAKLAEFGKAATKAIPAAPKKDDPPANKMEEIIGPKPASAATIKPGK